MLDESHVGRRVVVRHRLRQPVDGAVITDVTGQLAEVSDLLLRVRRDDGAMTEIGVATVVAAKPIPPKRTSYAAIAELERVCLDAWPPPEVEWNGRWAMRGGEGWTRRANSTLVLGEPDTDVETGIARVRDWYARRGQRACFVIPMPLAGRLDRVLDAAGWRHECVVLTQVSDIDGVVADAPGASVTTSVDREWLRLGYGDPDSLPSSAMGILTGGTDRGFARIRRSDEVVAVGRVAVESRTAVISSVKVADSHRRQGLAGRVMAGLTDWAARRGARRVVVQVEEDNVAARALYDRLGFTTHHRYHYRWA
ncbi:acetyltransferase (GNAT) family protein [Stackebrandtia endophytica]|uniref:Acetyltransferase (GNAT) family protein n=1 Tax=Stackebrandtia endophytica TaxID=1496996 RepID=A0A543B0N1_9ACTN|nr:GNAT family N-acetyltransferase [Stackebrandtia endophytica]TQL78346.1 acetyltransferase (GNAT) family protein [Stackebrandtia endophytica]